MYKGIIEDIKRINNTDNAYCIKFPHHSISRVYFVTSEGISRHIDMQNLRDCLEGIKLFDRDAFFFQGSRAALEADTILNSEGLTEHYRLDINQFKAMWDPTPYIPEPHNSHTLYLKKDSDIPNWSETIIPTVRKSVKQGRNSLCLCGSGLKNKRCCKEY